MKEVKYMRAFQSAVQIILKRPFVFLFFGILTFALCILDYFVSSVFISINAIGSGDIFESAVSIFQLVFNLVTDRGMIVKGALFFLGAVIVLSFVIAFAFSGCMNIINNTLDKKPKFSGEFVFGVKKYFGRIFIITLVVLGTGFLLAIFMMIASVPALVVTRSALSGRPEFFVVAVFLDIITLGVLFFGSMFYRIYILFWYPAALIYGKNAFKAGKYTADLVFWHLVSRFIVFDVIFFVFETLFIYANYIVALRETGSFFNVLAIFVVNWFFKASFFSLLAGYVFSAFKILSEKDKA